MIRQAGPENTDRLLRRRAGPFSPLASRPVPLASPQYVRRLLYRTAHTPEKEAAVALVALKHLAIIEVHAPHRRRIIGIRRRRPIGRLDVHNRKLKLAMPDSLGNTEARVTITAAWPRSAPRNGVLNPESPAGVEALATVNSKRGIPIRLTHERWSHNVESHDSMAGHLDFVVETLGDPDYVVAGVRGELLALKRYDHTAIGPKHVVVAYREYEGDGFIVTAFMTSKADKLIKRGLQWQKS